MYEPSVNHTAPLDGADLAHVATQILLNLPVQLAEWLR